MKYLKNIQSVAELQPDYLGFIFYKKSKRNFDGIIPKLPKLIKKVGVFVNANLDEVVEKINKYDLQAIQLHGDEKVKYISKLKLCLKEIPVEIIKVFSVDDNFNFDKIKEYESVVDYFLFDTKGKERGGSGKTFNWGILEKYNLTKPFFLSGGIGLEQVKSMKSFLKEQKSDYCYALDLNSKFEISAGLKNIEKLKEFKDNLIIYDLPTTNN